MSTEDRNGVTTKEWIARYAERDEQPLHHKFGRYLWVRITTSFADKTDEEKSAAFNHIRPTDRDRWWQIGADSIEAMDLLREGEEPASTAALALNQRKLIAKAIRFMEERLKSKGLDAKEKLQALAGLPKLTQSLANVAKVEAEMRAKDMDAWAGLTNEEKIDNFLMAIESWPAMHREYLATRIKELFPEAFSAASRTVLKSVV